MSKTSHNKTFFGIVMACMLVAFIIGFVMFLASCNAVNRAKRKSDKHFVKAIGYSYPTTAKNCSASFPTKDSIYEKLVYKKGDPIPYEVPKYIRANCDSLIAANKGKPVNNIFYIPCNCDSIVVDTLEHFKHVQQESQSALIAKEDELQAAVTEISNLNQSIATKDERIRWWRLGCIAFGGYMLARWLVLWLSKGKIKLP